MVLNPLEGLGGAALAACLLWLSALGGAFPAHAATNSPPAFDEVSGLVRSNLAGATAADLDRLAMEGFLDRLRPRVVLSEAADMSPAPAPGVGEMEAQLYRQSIGYLRLNAVFEDSAEQVRARYLELSASNRLSGLVLDLRSAGGGDYAAALRVADLFLAEEVPLLNWGEGLKRSTAKNQAIVLPVAVLLDRQTGGAAEALAAMLRQSGVALLIGGCTAGTAGIQRAFPLSNGQFLKITVANIQLGDARLLSVDGLKPDVEVESAAERKALARNGNPAVEDEPEARGPTNALPSRPRMNEADLVRRWRGEMVPSTPSAAAGADQAVEARDPVLLRALDLMDGLAVLRSWQK
jgi:hypothetical protein